MSESSDNCRFRNLNRQNRNPKPMATPTMNPQKVSMVMLPFRARTKNEIAMHMMLANTSAACAPEFYFLPTGQPFLNTRPLMSKKRARPKSMPEATRPRISEPCKWAASIRGLPRLLSSAIVPINAKPKPVKMLRFFICAPSARLPAPMYCDRNPAFVSPQREMHL